MPTETSAVKAPLCPCVDDRCSARNESADQLPAEPQPDRIITLVHGTFATCAPWTREGPLWDELDKLSDPEEPQGKSSSTLFQRFCWSGGNSHTDRLNAGAALQEQLDALAVKFPNAHKHVIGHSHGGNVMLYATKDPAVAKNVNSMVTMSTPFITVRRRKLPKLVLFGILAIALAGAFEAFLYFFGEKENGNGNIADEASLLVAILVLVLLVGTLISALLYRPKEKAFGLGKLFMLLRRGKDADAIVNEELQRMRLTTDNEKTMQDRYEKMLVARPIGDEASMTMIVSQFLSWFVNRILTLMSSNVKKFFSGIGLFLWIWKLLLLLVLFVVIVMVALPSLPDLFTFMSDALDPLFGNSGELRSKTEIAIRDGTAVTIIILMAPILVLGFLSLIAMIGLLLAGVACGPDAMFWNLFVSTTAESSPAGWARVYLQSAKPDSSGYAAAGLAHSRIYEDKKVIKEIVDWIRSREKTTTIS